MDSINIMDKRFTISISTEQINAAVKQLAEQLNRDLKGRQVIFLAILNGAFMFAADLLRGVSLPSMVSFVKLASYTGTCPGGEVSELIGINEILEGMTVVVVEDIVDTGGTLQKIIECIRPHRPAGIKVVTLFLKLNRYRGEVSPDYVGLKIPDDFVVGYGLDYKGYGRNLPAVYRLRGD